VAAAVRLVNRLVPEQTALFVVDVQERLAAAMTPARMETLARNMGILIDAAAILGVPIVASEQYPKGLGSTVASVAEKLSAARVTPRAKMTFDACGDPAIARVLAAMAPRSVVLVGMETHVCVFQTARELARRGIDVHVASDAVASRSEENRAVGLALCERAGATVTVTETVVFDWLERAGTDAFKAVSKLVR
jgi:nicotinamidase-related amidase